MDVPVWAGGHLAGVLCHEQTQGGRPWSYGDEQFALAVAQVVSTMLETRARTRAEQAEFRCRFLSDVSGVLSGTLDVKEVAGRAARIALPVLGETCTIDLLQGDATRRVAIAATDREREARLEEFSRLFPPTPKGAHFTMHAMRRGEGIIVPDVDPEHLAAHGFAGAELEYCLQAKMLPRSLMAVPLLVQGRVLGGVALATYRRQYFLDDLRLAQEFAHRVAAVLANAQLYTQAIEAIRARDEFIAIASHELRTPLTSLTLATETLSRQLVSASPDRVTQAADAIVRQTRSLNELVDRMLDVARSGGGGLLLQREPVDLAQLVRDVARSFAPALERAGSALELSVATSVRGSWDGHRLQEVVGNLLDNAIKFGRGHAIEVSLEEVGGRVVLTVRDHGIGIAPERLPFVFNRFERAVTTREFGGLGLGLYITRLIVEAHGGTIRIDSRPGGRHDRRRRVTGRRGPRMTDGTLLVVDDDPDILETMGMVLEASGYRVIAARDGQIALDLLRGGERPELILLDLMMPGMDGWTFLSEQERDSELAAIPVVVISADTDAVRRAATLKVAAGLCKPMDVDSLLDAVQRHRRVPG